jgi:RNA polymerase sigma-70 factor (ECF subfamily)
MLSATDDTTALVGRLRADAPGATDDLVRHACDRLRLLARRMLRQYPAVARWEQTDDVLQNALIRLTRALSDAPPTSARHFHNLATLQIRRELLDLAAKHAGPLGAAANHRTDSRQRAVGAVGDEPADLQGWTAFHETVERLPADKRELFGLIWYQGLSQEEAADHLGLSVRTVKRRWQAARVALADALGEPPGS